MPEREPSFEQEEKEIDPEFIGKVENAKLQIPDKVNLLLVKAGVKPATEITFNVGSDGEIISLTTKELEDIESLIGQSGLPYEIMRTIISPEKPELIEALVSGSADTLEKIKVAFEAMPSMQEVERGEYSHERRMSNYKDLGTAFGYPPTAVEAFTGQGAKERLDDKNLRQEVRESDAFIFSRFALSKDNWQEELKQGEVWADCIRSLSPKLYQEMREHVEAALENKAEIFQEIEEMPSEILEKGRELIKPLGEKIKKLKEE